eukprot:s4025_g11.t1
MFQGLYTLQRFGPRSRRGHGSCCPPLRLARRPTYSGLRPLQQQQLIRALQLSMRSNGTVYTDSAQGDVRLQELSNLPSSCKVSAMGLLQAEGPHLFAQDL